MERLSSSELHVSNRYPPAQSSAPLDSAAHLIETARRLQLFVMAVRSAKRSWPSPSRRCSVECAEVSMETRRSANLRKDIAQCMSLIEALESGKLNDVEHPRIHIIEQKRKLAELE